MKSSLRLAIAFIGITLPIATLALAPVAVGGLSGRMQPDGSVKIEWTPLADPSIVLYRLYYSSESILENEGLYDDYEETEGPVGEFIFEDPSEQSSLFVTVLAVNDSGEESESFAEEVRVDIPKNPAQPTTMPATSSASAFTSPSGVHVPLSSTGKFSSATSSAPVNVVSQKPSSAIVVSRASSSAPKALPVLTLPPQAATSAAGNAAVPVLTPPPEDGNVHLLLAEALSPTQVKLTLSDPVTIAPVDAPRAFRIEGPDKSLLRIKQLLISGQVVILDTDSQTKDALYTITLSEPLTSKKGQPLDPTDRSASFPGHTLGNTLPVVAVSLPTPVTAVPLQITDVTGFRLQAQPEQGGKTYTVTAQWQPDLSRSDLAYYIVRQSLDGGATFNEPQMVPMDVGGIEIKGVQPGELGIALNVVSISGAKSTGVFSTVTLPGAKNIPTFGPTPTRPTVSQKVTAMTTSGPPPPSWNAPSAQTAHTSGLPQSGMGLVVIGSSVIGSYVGWRKSKKTSVV